MTLRSSSGNTFIIHALPLGAPHPSPATVLPAGLTKIPIDGQPLSIVQDLEEMARRYVQGENAIILAVSPANADLATSDAIRMAREVGRR